MRCPLCGCNSVARNLSGQHGNRTCTRIDCRPCHCALLEHLGRGLGKNATIITIEVSLRNCVAYVCVKRTNTAESTDAVNCHIINVVAAIAVTRPRAKRRQCRQATKFLHLCKPQKLTCRSGQRCHL
jgi:hypothetical protein